MEEESAAFGRSFFDVDDVGSAADDEVGGVGLSTPSVLGRIFFVLGMDAKASLSPSDDELLPSSNALRGRPRRCTIDACSIRKTR